MEEAEVRRRWQLVLGPEARGAEGEPLAREWSAKDEELAQVLDYLFGREHEGDRAMLRDRRGDLGRSSLTIPHWLARVRDLFPRSTAETLTRLALERYQMTEILADEETLGRMEPNLDLLRALLATRSLVPERVLGAVRRVIRKVVEELRAKLETKVRRHFAGARRRHTTSPLKIAKNFDLSRTLRRNLKNFQPAEGKLVVERMYFHSREQRQNPWDIILVIDQSGSMIDSVIHSAVMGGIFKSLPMLRTRLLVFDTEVVDLSQELADPAELLLRAQLGGGTDIARALQHAEGLVSQPRRTIVVLVTDFCEGGDEGALVEMTGKLAGHGVTLLGLAALDEKADPAYNKGLARRLAKRGMQVGAMTPDRLAEWVAERVRT